MPNLIVWIVIFIVSLFVLIKASDFFTDAAEKIGISLGISPFLVGVTIVSVGTSLPELVSSIIAVYQNSSEIVFGNVVGSNIANIFLIIGTASLISSPLRIQYELINVDLPLFVGSAFLLGLTVLDNNFSKNEAIICILGYVVYVLYTISSGKEEQELEKDGNRNSKKILPTKQIAILVISSLFVFLGATYTIESVTKISKILDIAKELIALSAVALGTSLPELIVTISAAKKGHPEIAVGNVLGSNIFNSLMVLGIPGLIGNLEIPKDLIGGGLLVLLAGTIMFFFVTQDKQVTRWEGLIFFLFYGWFIGNIFGLV
ncbi:MAG: calcium/sodium antiporter [Okeania sp. SIO2G4]|uniref:calcium/sodium antiporter n=1 Tax=unclassified Okeania TaxID=2634635 RepID=UPI0013B975C4|nr:MULTISPECIES: calcium/sodium antiporter [unclassified Okeania]NEP07393.1 calcium/sodium antiporter [Okeania sp. SIO4D6]NEP75959.1 calcium/sodium antiporter [Okeania sp. SIO2G5]NEP97132.1 calcium/sodium antiporter [Okeania sp. SIO2F5]NEQ94840.1 calcium/sodium antiporter [Okeania sp. SIO2G4]